MAYDLLIKNGRVVDGTGELGFLADVAVQDGTIVGVGKYAGAAATRTIAPPAAFESANVRAAVEVFNRSSPSVGAIDSSSS